MACTDLLAGLPERHVARIRLWELVKTALIQGELAWAQELLQEGPLKVAWVERALAFKAGVVHRDPREAGERRLLNLGHTPAAWESPHARLLALLHQESAMSDFHFTAHGAPLAAPPPARRMSEPFMSRPALQVRGGGADPKAAAALYRRVLAQVPESAEAHLRLSEALQEAQDADAAVAPARRAVELAPQSAEAQAHLALPPVRRGAEGNQPRAGGHPGTEGRHAYRPRIQALGAWARASSWSRRGKGPCGLAAAAGPPAPGLQPAWGGPHPRPRHPRTTRASGKPCWPSMPGAPMTGTCGCWRSWPGSRSRQATWPMPRRASSCWPAMFRWNPVCGRTCPSCASRPHAGPRPSTPWPRPRRGSPAPP
ncbi:MAG: hypothetical protein IPO28_07535 [Holophagaceae bacterium]|nr:hypothetical protein [Holophagaceae bacterium]